MTVPDQLLGDVLIRWHGLPFRPDPALVTQAYGMCFTADGQLVLINGHLDEPYWNLPGGQLEAGETPEQALVREVAEEACARVIASEYIGCQELIGDRPEPHFQTRFWCRIELDAWDPQFEIAERRSIAPAEFTSTLAWGEAPTAHELIRLALEVEQRHTGLVHTTE